MHMRGHSLKLHVNRVHFTLIYGDTFFTERVIDIWMRSLSLLNHSTHFQETNAKALHEWVISKTSQVCLTEAVDRARFLGRP